MKILCVIDNLGSGGAQRQIVTLAKELKKKGYLIDIFTYYPQNFFKESLDEAGVNTIRIKKVGRLGLNVVLSLRKALLNGGYDIAISYLKTPNFYLAVASKLAKVKTKIITSERSRTNFENGSKFNFFYRWGHLQADAIVFNSFHERINWTRRFPEFEEKSYTIYNGIDTEIFKPVNKIKKNNKKVLGVGSVNPTKNIQCLIESIYLLKAQGIEIEVDWYGRQILEIESSATYVKEVNQKIKELNIQDLWRWKEPTSIIEGVYSKYDALILPSVVEGLPNVACEALASGLPVIISNLFDHATLVEEGKRGFLFDANNPVDLANKLNRFYALNALETAFLRNNAREFAETNLSINKFLSSYEKLFLSLIER